MTIYIDPPGAEDGPAAASPTQITQIRTDLDVYSKAEASAISNAKVQDSTSGSSTTIAPSVRAVNAAIEAALAGGVSITVVADSVSTPEDTPVSGNVLTNDTTTSGTLVVQQFTVAGVVGIFQPAQTATITGIGSVVIASDGAYTFTPVANYNGAVPAISYQVNNGTDVRLGALIITVTAVADAPSAIDNAVSCAINTVATFNPLVNDVSIDGGTLSVTQINGAAITSGGAAVSITNGSVTLTTGNVLNVTPATDYVGVVNFTYRCTDSNGLHSTAAVALTVSDPEGGVSGDYYISPNGSNSNAGTTPATPFKTFAYAFSVGGGAKTYVLMDGTYTAAETGTLNWNTGANSAQVPSGTSVGARTVIVARNRGQAVVEGLLFIGRSFRKDSFIKIDGVRFNGGAQMYNTSYCIFKNLAVNGPLTIGTNDHDNGNTYNLIEDCWTWAAAQRIIAINYRAHYCVWRRVVVRGDGCGTGACAGSGNPNVGFTVYDSHDVSVQNVVVVDRVLSGSDSHYSDFAIASHTGGFYMFGRNEWLGCISLNAPDSGYYMEPDNTTTVDPTIKIENCVAWGAVEAGINMAREQTNTVINAVTISVSGGDAFRAAPELAGQGATYQNMIVRGAGRYALNSANVCNYVNVTGTWSQGAYNGTTPTNATTVDPIGASLKHVTRIEAGSALKAAGYGGADVGATVLKRYGVDGSIHGETSYNTLSATDLWPWPNEGLIKTHMSEATSRGFCAPGQRLDGVNPVTLTSYIWEAIGYAIPEDVYPITSAPTIITTPVIAGVYVHGATLSVNTGSWAGVPTAYGYQWLRNGSPIVGASSATYTLALGDVAATVTARVSATNAVGTSYATTTGDVVSAATAPTNASAPTISGDLYAGNVLTCAPGSWAGAPAPTYAYQWRLAGSPIGGATNATHTAATAGAYTCSVTATNVAGSSSPATSASATVATAAAPSNTVAPAITGTALEGQTLTCSTGTWTGSPTITYARQWKRSATNIGTNSATYVLVSGDIGQPITCVVTATNGGGSVDATSNTVTPSSTTTIADDMTEGAYPVALQSHTASGTGGGFTWSKPGGINTSDINLITGGRVRSSVSTGFQPYIASTVPASANQDIYGDMAFPSLGQTSVYIGGRISSTAADGYWAFQSASAWRLYRRLSGAWTELGNVAESATATTLSMHLELRDGSQKLFRNGVQILATTDTAITAAGRVGVATYYTDANDNNWLDNWAASWPA